MIKKNSREIFEQLDKYEYPKEISAIYNLIKEYPDRIHFVKDHNGVRNLLFFVTQEASYLFFEKTCFSLFTKGQTSDNTFDARISYTTDDIFDETKFFLENTNETLYVGVGFEESQVTNDDYWNIYSLMDKTKCAVNDAFVTLRRFPEWYEKLADLPFFIQKEELLLSEMEKNELEHLKNMKNEFNKKLIEVIENNDEEEFVKLSEQMKILINQLKEKGAY